MPGPFLCSEFGNPELSWYIMFFDERDEHYQCIQRVSEIIRGPDSDTFYTELVNTSFDGEDINWTNAYEHDMNFYNIAGAWWKNSFGNPVIGSHIYYNYQWMRVNFVGDYTIDMEVAFPEENEENENIFTIQEEINYQGNNGIF
jgi:hypothetical protein